jgi:transposase-like protein
LRHDIHSSSTSRPITRQPITNCSITPHLTIDEVATKLLCLILNRSEKEWKMPPREWSMAKTQFAVIFGERFIKAMAA